MFSPSYAWHELRRRFGRTLVTALGLAAGVGLVMSIIGVSDGLSAAQNSVLSPLGSVGTNVIVTRTVAATTNKNASSIDDEQLRSPPGAAAAADSSGKASPGQAPQR